MNKDLKDYLACVEHWLSLHAAKQEVPPVILAYFTDILLTGCLPDVEGHFPAWNARYVFEYGSLERSCYALIRIGFDNDARRMVNDYEYELGKHGITPPVAPLH